MIRFVFAKVTAYDGLADGLRREPTKFRRAVHGDDTIAIKPAISPGTAAEVENSTTMREN